MEYFTKRPGKSLELVIVVIGIYSSYLYFGVMQEHM